MTGPRRETPIACVMNALSPQQRERQQALLNLVRARIQETSDLSDGFALRLPPSAEGFVEAAEWLSLERRCCPFAQLSLEWREDESIWVILKGPPGAKDVFAAEMLKR